MTNRPEHPALAALREIRDQDEPQHPTATWAAEHAAAAIPQLEALLAERDRLRRALEATPQAVYDEIVMEVGDTLAKAAAHAAKWQLRQALAKLPGGA